MAAINLPEQQLTFVHIPKNAGSSVVEWLLSNYSNAVLTKGHPSLSILKEQWDIKRSFAIVRNPWARVVSAYFYLQQYKFYWEKNNIKTIDDFPSWDSFVHNMDYDLESWYTLANNQIEWVDSATIILRTESLEKDFRQVQDILNCHVPLGYINTSKHDDYRSYYTTEQQQHVAKVFERDIDLFNYSFQ